MAALNPLPILAEVPSSNTIRERAVRSGR